MDRTTYDENPSNAQGVVPYTINVKPSFTLDFNSARSRQPMDLGFLKLGSPELERFLVQSDGSVVTALTPTTQILFPKSVTEEQEAYARGFIDALEELHRRQGIPSSPPLEESLSTFSTKNSDHIFSTNISSLSMNSSADVPTRDAPLSPSPHLTQVKTAVLPPALTLLSRSSKSYDASLNSLVNGNVSNATTSSKTGNILLDENYQAVPKLISSPPSSTASLSGDSPSPMSANEDFDRLEMKRARNRLAAQKCRSRKLERIAVLSQRVEELKEQNAQLHLLKQEAFKNVEELKTRLSKHAICGNLDLSLSTVLLSTKAFLLKMQVLHFN